MPPGSSCDTGSALGSLERLCMDELKLLGPFLTLVKEKGFTLQKNAPGDFSTAWRETSLADMPGLRVLELSLLCQNRKGNSLVQHLGLACVHHTGKLDPFPPLVRVSWTCHMKAAELSDLAREEPGHHRGNRSEPHNQVEEREGFRGNQVSVLWEQNPPWPRIRMLGEMTPTEKHVCHSTRCCREVGKLGWPGPHSSEGEK